MAKHSDLMSLQEYVDDHALELIFGAGIANLFGTVRKSVPTGFSEEDLVRCGWEEAIFHVHFQEGEARATEFVRYLDTAAHAYLEDRLKTTRSPLLIARYSHALWSLFGCKHEKHARVAVEAYLELVRIFEKKALDEPAGSYGCQLLLAAGNAYSLSYQAQYRWEETKSEVKRLALEFDFANPASFNLRRGLIRLLLDRRRKIEKQDLDGVSAVCWTLYEHLRKSGHGEVALDALELGETVDARLSVRSYDWVAERAQCCEELMTKYRNTPNEIMHWEEALDAYKKANNFEKVRELEQKYDEIKASTPITRFSEAVDLTQHVERCKNRAHELAQWDSSRIIRFLINDQGLLPNCSDLHRGEYAGRQDHHVIDLMPTGTMDFRGHVIQHFAEEEEREYRNFLSSYRLYLELSNLIFIKEVLFAVLRAGKLDATMLLRHLQEYTWLGDTRLLRKPGGGQLEYRWIDLLAPSVKECFRGLQHELVGAAEDGQHVVGLDSLTLKFEGLLRDLCESHGITTFLAKNDSKGRQIFQEKDLNALLREDGLKAVLNEDDLLFFRFLLVEQAGYNLRNLIAHSLVVSPDEYSVDYVVLMILALLRLAKYPLGTAAASERGCSTRG